ncbi:MAG: TlpA family protein disulfide reductase [Chloroflexota bacterium]
MGKKKNSLAIFTISIAGIISLGWLGMKIAFRYAPAVERYILESRSLRAGDAAPDFELTALTGETVRLSQFRGKPVLLSMGATWCPDCRREAPLLEELHQTHLELVVLTVDIQESSQDVQQFADEFGLTHPILLDYDGEVKGLYQVFAIPTEFFIDEEGIIRAKIIEQVTPQLLAEYLPLIGVTP